MDEDFTDPGSVARLLTLKDAALESEEMRPLRLAREFLLADAALAERQISSTIVVFGGHLIVSPETADAALHRADGPEQRARALRMKELSAWYTEARRFARIVSERGGALATGTPRENVIATGGGPGIMEAANRGAADAGAPTIGFNIALPAEQPPNPYTTSELTFTFRYFAIRKMHFAIRAKALAIFPGGFGTIDELFEILTLKQTGKTAPIPVILFSREFWRSIVNFEALVDCGTIAPADAGLFEMVDTAEEGWAALVRHGLMTEPPAKDL